jgi:exoribonuclease R
MTMATSHKAPSEARMRDAFNILENHIEERYQIPVRIRDVPNPFSGDMDGAEIHVDYDEDIESALFVIAHLFGHTVQWNTSEAARDIGYRLHPNPSDELMQRLLAYEREACQYSIQLFQNAGLTDFDQWLSDYSACDLAFLMSYYKTGVKKPFREFWKDGSPLMLPKTVPPFHATKWVFRNDGIVV